MALKNRNILARVEKVDGVMFLAMSREDDRPTPGQWLHIRGREITVGQEGYLSYFSHGSMASWDFHAEPRGPTCGMYKIEPEGEEPYETSWIELQQKTTDDLYALALVGALDLGESVTLGGGASPTVLVSRVL